MEVMHEIMHDFHSTKPSSAFSQLAVHFPLKSKKQFNHILSALNNTLHKLMKTCITHWEQSVEEDKNSQNVETQRSERTTSPAWGAQTKPKRGGGARGVNYGAGGVCTSCGRNALTLI